LHWRVVLSSTWEGPHHQELIERKFTVVPVSAETTIGLFEVLGQQQFASANLTADAWSRLFKSL
jgi:hypothetical protein